MRDDIWEIDDYILSEEGSRLYQLLEPIEDNGKFYIVRALDMKSGVRCFLKFMPANGTLSKANNLFREGNFQFHYPYIERVYGNFRGLDPKGKPIYGVSVELLDGSDLYDYRQDLERQLVRKEITESEMERIIFRQIMQFLYGMNYYSQFAAKSYLHRDIKPENIMITSQGEVKIVDFDFAHLSGSKKTIFKSGWNLPISKGYTSPELFFLKEKDKAGNLRMDIYSAGRVLFYWLNGVDYYPQDQLETDQMRSCVEEGDISVFPYCAREELRYGFEANSDRFKPKYFKPAYKKMMQILERMCSEPDSGNCYRNVMEIIKDMKMFLLEYCESSPKKLEDYIRFQEFPILEEKIDQSERKFRMVIHQVDTNLKSGKPLYENTMRDIEINGNLIMTIYNRNNEIYYIPALGTQIRRQGERKDYRILNQDIIYCDNYEIDFTVV